VSALQSERDGLRKDYQELLIKYESLERQNQRQRMVLKAGGSVLAASIIVNVLQALF